MYGEKMFLRLSRWISELLDPNSDRIYPDDSFFVGGLPRMYINMNEEKTFS